METVAVIDFETTGMSPAQGARATEVAVVLVRGGQVVDRYQSLMNSGAWVPPFIEQLTGITNQMLKDAPPAEQVMREAVAFCAGTPLVAHNASFDRGFWLAESQRAGCEPDPSHSFACTLLLSRRLHPNAPNHKLGTLADWHALPRAGRAHRALADAEVTAHLWSHQHAAVQTQFADQLGGHRVTHALLLALQRANKGQLARCIDRHLAAATHRPC